MGETDKEDPGDGDDQAEEAHLDLPPEATGQVLMVFLKSKTQMVSEE